MKRLITAVYAASMCFIAVPSFADPIVTPTLKVLVDGMADTEANIVRFDVDPGWQAGHHTHPGHVFVYVLEGSLHIDVDGKDPVDYGPGEAFYELPNIGMDGGNISTTDRTKFIVFQFGAAGQPLMVAD